MRWLPLDVTSDAQAGEAEAAVRAWTEERAGRRVLGVVNNAGIGRGGYVEWCTQRAFEEDVAVNYLGVVHYLEDVLRLLRA